MFPTGPVPEKVGFALSRVVVPLWILTGATVKLLAGSPINLPKNFVAFAQATGIDLDVMLYTLIGLEFFAIAVMVGMARFARPMAIFMLSVFCAVLIGEMIRGEESCGCFGGGVQVAPWQMLLVDSLLLAGVILFRPKVADEALGLPKAAPIAAALAVVGIGVSFAAAAVLHPEREQNPEVTEHDADLNPTVNPNPRSLPSWWYAQDLNAWVGKPWREAEIFQFMQRWPAGLDEGKHYVVFYSRTCGHCAEMFEFDLAGILPAPVIAVQIPAGRNRLVGENPLFDPHDAAAVTEHLALPLGPDWNMMTAPLALRIEDGIITCAEEGDHENCMELLP